MYTDSMKNQPNACISKGLEEMVCPHAVKKQLRGIIPLLPFYCIEGGPGSYIFSGSWTEAKLPAAQKLGEILREMKLIYRGNVVRHTPDEFIGASVGETSRKARDICGAALGCILFIDRAEELFCQRNGQTFFASDYHHVAMIEVLNYIEHNFQHIGVIFSGDFKTDDFISLDNRFHTEIICTLDFTAETL